MAISHKNSGAVAFVPHRWLMLTAAGAATVGLACGFAKPALAEWWKLSKADRNTTVSKPAPVENGFAGTIRKLTAESRRAAEQGDYAKAEQLAARAAKISEAAAQVVGPQGECSPQETARYLAETRARRNGTTVAAQASAPATQQTVQQFHNPISVPQQSLVQSQPPAQPVVPARPAPATPAKQKAQAAQAGRATVKSQPAAVASSSATTGASLFGKSANPAPQANSRSQASRTTAALPPSPSQSMSTADNLLAQSRLEAADGQLDRAIALADQAMAASPPASLFGTSAHTTNSSEAARWRDRLVAQRDASTAIAVAPVKQSSSNTASQAPSTWEEASREKPQEQFADARSNQIASVTTPAQGRVSSQSLSTEDLPPAPAPQPKQSREEIRFRRSEISRQGEWVDASTVASPTANNVPATNDEAPPPPEEPAIEESPIVQEPLETSPEFPIVEAATPTIAEEPTTEQPAVEQPVASEQPTDTPVTEPSVADDEPVASPREELVAERPPLKLRGSIQQVAGEFPPQSSSIKKPIADAQAKPEESPFELPAESKPETPDKLKNEIPVRSIPDNVIAKLADESSPPDFPVQRFPVQRVLQLRERLQTASTFDPGASKFGTPKTTSAPTTNPQKPSTAKAAEWEGDPEDTPSSAPVRHETTSSTRASLKLRERLPVTNESDEPAEKESTAIAKRAPVTRPAAVGRSEVTRWQSADELPAAKEPSLPADAGKTPVSQVGYEAPIVPPEANSISPDIAAEATKVEQANVAPPPPAWYDDGLVRKRAASSEASRKRSFTLIDQLASTLNVPASTIVSLIGAGGFVLMGIGLVAVRSALKKRHEA